MDRFIAIEIDRVQFARACRSQTIAMRVLAAIAHGRPGDARQLSAYGIRYRCGRLDHDHVEDASVPDSWDWGA
jgi:hypothetical protein